MCHATQMQIRLITRVEWFIFSVSNGQVTPFKHTKTTKMRRKYAFHPLNGFGEFCRRQCDIRSSDITIQLVVGDDF